MLNIRRIDFEIPDNSCEGYAERRSIAVSPTAAYPERTLLHEMAHVLMGHTKAGPMFDDGELMRDDVREFEAEATAMICCAAVGFSGVEESGGHIQSSWNAQTIDYEAARRIFGTLDKILRAGREQ